jgi:hypothetical protein
MDCRIVIACAVMTAIPGAREMAQIDRRLTVPELVARQAPEPLVQFRVRELLPQPLEQIVPKADLIVQGKVESSKAYLSDDQRDLYTDYVITPIRTMFKRGGPVLRKPSADTPVIVQCWGGRTVIQGTPVTVEDKDFRPFSTGEEVVLILKYNSADGKYRLVGPVSGAFAVVGGHVSSIVQHPNYERYEGMTPAAFESEVLRMSR